MTDTSEGALRPPGFYSLAKVPEILRALVTRELKVKYKRSVLGFMWSLVTPVLLTGVYLFVFIYVYKVEQKDFVLFLLSGLLPWNYFSMSVLTGTSSIVENGPLIRKVYFPRALVPISVVTANLINFLMGFGLLMVVVLFTGRPLWLNLHWLVIAILLESALAIGIVLMLSVWNVYLRDISQIISILIIVAFFVTPIVYETSQVPSQFLPVILANPMSSIMEIYRSALFHSRSPDLQLVLLGTVEVLIVLGLGTLAFKKISPDLAKEV